MFQRGLECALVLLEGPDLPRVKKKKRKKKKKKREGSVGSLPSSVAYAFFFDA